MFGGGTLVTVLGPAPLLGSKAAQTALVGLLAQVAPGNGLVFLDLVDGSQARKPPVALARLRDAVIAAGGEASEIRAPRRGELAGWIEARARESGARTAGGAAQARPRRVGGFVTEGDVDRSRMSALAVGELAKLSIYRSGEAVRVEDVRALVPEAVPASSWAFLDAVGERRAGAAAELLPRILGATPEPVLIAILHRRLRELIQVADLLADGAVPGSIVRTLGLHPTRAQHLVGQASRWSLPELEGALEGLLELDARMKGVEGSTAAQRRLAVMLWLAERVEGRPGAAGAGITPGQRS
jgi:DNA polymerase III delta subunit